MIPIIIGALGSVSINFPSYMESVQICKYCLKIDDVMNSTVL